MNKKTYSILLLLLISVAFFLHQFGTDAGKVERVYSRGLYPAVSRGLKLAVSISPVSVGDILYGITGLFFILVFLRFLRAVFTGSLQWSSLVQKIMWMIPFLLGIYVLFNGLWGFNYNRMGLGAQLGLDTTGITGDEIRQIDSLLLEKVNLVRGRNDFREAASARQVFTEAAKAYQKASLRYPFLQNGEPLVRSSIWGIIGDYAGFMGYYNPFTGEAHVNTRIPCFLMPYTTCHEIAHQSGYAKENEANFAGYLAASNSDDPFFHYSVYLDLFLYANQDLFLHDSTLARKRISGLSPPVQHDLLAWKRYVQKQDNPAADFVGRFYELYLRNNQQPSGLRTYSEVTRFLIAFHRKFGSL
jgi:hypothetical protein